ncbi:MAG: HutD family protein [Xanthomonadaceae bacterium]|nr:HutD family protein [Xanthomonadaceae bacterium]
MVRILPAHHYRRERWRNGAGWTREIVRLRAVGDGGWSACDADAGDAWDLRFSIAEIDRDCAFSAFPGVQRELVLLRGDGVELAFGDGRLAAVDPPHGRIRFDGADAPACRLIGGPTHDFNLMWRAPRVDAQLLHRPLVGAMVFFAGAGVAWLVYLISGRASFRDRPELPPLQAGDSALIGGEAGRGRVLLDGGGEALLVRFAHVAEAD